MGLCQAKRMVGPVRADLERLKRQPQIIDGRCGRRKVIDKIDRLVDEVGTNDVAVDVEELGATDVLDVCQRPSLQIVNADYAVAAKQEFVAEVGPEKAGTASH